MSDRAAQLRVAKGPNEWVLLFVLANLVLIGADVAFAHMPIFDRTPRAMWPVTAMIPYVAVTAVVLWPWLRKRAFETLNAMQAGLLRVMFVGSIILGGVGTWFHYDSQEVWGATLERFIFSAPILAPLMYVGLGVLGLIYLDVADRAVRRRLYWLSAAGGLMANAIILLLDHAQNGFMHWAEILAVAVAVVPIPLAFWTAINDDRTTLVQSNFIAGIVLGAVGLIGIGFHMYSLLTHYGMNIMHWHDGVPPIAPGLMVDYAILILILAYGDRET